MEVRSRNGGRNGILLLLEATLDRHYSTCLELKRSITSKLGLQDGDEANFYLQWNGRLLQEDDQVSALSSSGSGYDDETETTAPVVVGIIPRLLGGKGGFGSMLRAIGAQIEKTTNRDACRDLSGRRLRDINEEQRLKKWFAKQEEREQEKREAKRRKLDRLRQVAEGPPLPKIEDQQYLQQREEMVEAVFEAVDKGFEASASSSSAVATNVASKLSDSSSSSIPEKTNNRLELDDESGGPSSSMMGSSAAAVAAAAASKNNRKPEKKVVKKTMFDEDLDSSTSSDEESSEEEDTSPKKAKLG